MRVCTVIRLTEGSQSNFTVLESELGQYLSDNPINLNEIVCIKVTEVDYV